MSQQLHTEKAKLDKLQNKITELEHSNSILRMENDIIGERIKVEFQDIVGGLSRDVFIDETGFY